MDKENKKLEHDLLSDKYTEVFYDDQFKYNAPHWFKVMAAKPYKEQGMPTVLSMIKFQEGPIQECGVNGVMNEDLIAMVICRLQHFQQTEFACRENAMAITKLEEAMLWLRKRTMAREKRGVEGTYNV